MEQMSFLGWIIIGGLAGWIASKFMGTDKDQGVIANIIVGVIGAFIGGFGAIGNFVELFYLPSVHRDTN